MNKRELQQLNQFPKAIDKAVKQEFGEETECQSEYSFIDMNYITRFKDNGSNKAGINAFIKGYIAGNTELRERLPYTDNWQE